MATLLKITPLVAALAGTACTDLRSLDHDPPFHPLGGERWRLQGHQASLRQDGDRIWFESSIPSRASTCRAALPGEDRTCADADGDELADLWEKALLERTQPFTRLHRNEPMFGDRSGRAVALGRVFLAREAAGHVRVLIALLYHRDYGRCSFTGHRGDVERVALDLVEEQDGTFTLAGAYTAAHEYTAFDGGRLRRGPAELAELGFVRDGSGIRWRVHVSSGKHATYASREACLGHSAAICAREDCPGPGDAGEDHLFGFFWAGEPPPACEGPAWSSLPFCGLGRSWDMDSTPCAPPVKDKLLKDPFAGHREVPGPTDRPSGDPDGCSDPYLGYLLPGSS